MLRILIADDHPVFRRGLRNLIAEASDMVVAGEAASGPEALTMAGTGNYDVVLLDISMPGKNGMDVLRQLTRERLGLSVLMLSMHPEEQYAVRALRSGASGYLTKESAPEELVKAIRKVATGGKYVSSSLAERLAARLQVGGPQSSHETLSNREYGVMCAIASGKTVTEIAAELSLSVKTVSTYRCRVLVKMKMKNNAELTHYAVGRGLA